MKPIVKKILESGLVEKNAVLLMEKWGHMDRGASELVGTKDIRTATESTLTKFAEEIEDLLEQDREEVRETRLAIQVGEPMLAQWVSSPAIGPIKMSNSMVLFRDSMGNFIFPVREDELVKAGAVFRTTDGVEHTILSYDVLSVGTKTLDPNSMGGKDYAIQVLTEQ